MRTIVLRIADASPNGQVSTTEAKERASKYFDPTPGDMKPNPLDGNELMYYQIIAKVIGSDQANKASLYYKGFAERTEDGIRITEAGRAYLRKRMHLMAIGIIKL
jgi:hypothetical protein